MKVKDKKGIVMLSVLLVVTMVSVYLTGYVIWTIYDQRHLLIERKIALAKRIARAGLERAKAELYLDSNWIDGEVNGKNLTDSLGNPITGPDPNDPDEWYFLYKNVSLGEGNYTVMIDYLQKPRSCTSGCSFYKRRLHLRSIGRVENFVKTLEEFIWEEPIKNLNQNTYYEELQTAINEAQDNNTLAITDAVLNELSINTNSTLAQNFSIKGCYDPSFQTRNCQNYLSYIEGNVTISGNVQVEIGGITVR